jgi:hypothetical protein
MTLYSLPLPCRRVQTKITHVIRCHSMKNGRRSQIYMRWFLCFNFDARIDHLSCIVKEIFTH